MYVNDRDQINYHGFLRALREMQAVNVNQVSEGICSRSEVTRMEIGDRLPEKLLRDRITSRLGVSGEEYEEYLRAEEYRQWQIRMYILECLDNGNIGEVMININSLRALPAQNQVQKQFVATMEYLYLQQMGAPHGELCAQLLLAISYTIPSVDAAFKGAHLLSDQELNLIMEYAHICEYEGEPEKEAEWRMAQFRRVMNYIDNSYIDAIGKAKLYPKLTCHVCDVLVKEGASVGTLHYALDLCGKSIEMLRDASRLYYFVELLEWRKEIIRLLTLPSRGPINSSEYMKILEKNNEWETLLKELYAEYDVPARMQTFTYLYVETECNSAIEVIRTRRNMLKLSRAKLSDGLCAEKTIIRFENYETSPSIVLMRDLFERINLCAEYRRARVLTDNAEVLKLSNKLVENINNYEFDEWERNVEELRNSLDVGISYNAQVVSRMESQLDYEKHNITNDELYERCIEALECTIPLDAVVRFGNKYFTKSEWTCMNSIAFESTGELSAECRRIIEKMCMGHLDKEIEVARITLFELLTARLESYFGNKEMFEKSNAISHKMLKECLKNRRMVELYCHVYNLLWNNQEISRKNGTSLEREYEIKMLKRSILFCELVRKNEAIPFFQQRLSELSNKKS